MWAAQSLLCTSRKLEGTVQSPKSSWCDWRQASHSLGTQRTVVSWWSGPAPVFQSKPTVRRRRSKKTWSRHYTQEQRTCLSVTLTNGCCTLTRAEQRTSQPCCVVGGHLLLCCGSWLGCAESSARLVASGHVLLTPRWIGARQSQS